MKRVIVLSNTVGRKFKNSVKTTAVRYFNDFEVVSLLTSHECDYLSLIKKISQNSEHIFVDLEKKQPLNLENQFNQGGNLFHSVLLAIKKLNLNKKLNLYPIKLNDITVNATWKILNEEFHDVAGLDLGIIGAGNIGAKLINILTESGVRLKCYNRDINKLISVVNSILLTKPAEVIASPNIVRKIEHTISKSSGLILSCSQIDDDISEYSYLMKDNFKIYLIGHSLLKLNSLKKLLNQNIDIKKIDVGKELLNYIIGTIITKDYSVYGSKSINNLKICSGGFIGNKGEAIVDNYKNPKFLYSVCDGVGGVDYTNISHPLNSLEQLDIEYN